MLIVFALLAFLVGLPAFGQCHGIALPANFGGNAGAPASYADSFPTYPETFIAQTHPATAAISVQTIDFRVIVGTAFSPFTVRFLAVTPSGTKYTVRNASGILSFTPGASGGQAFVATINPPLQFQPGDLLGATFYSASGGGPAVSNESVPSAYTVFRSTDAPAGTQLSRDSAGFTGSAAIAMETVQNVPCDQLPLPSVLVPVVGDVQGAAHFTTDFTTYFAPIGSGGTTPIQLTLRDRMGGSPRIATATVNANVGYAYHPASLTTTLNVTPPYFGPLIVSFGGTGGLQTSAMFASARVTAATASCSGGETGTAIDAVSCSGIGHEIAIPFHVPPNHRLNIGVASAELNSCGIFAPATSVEVWIVGVISGPHVIVSMPGESTQIGDITGAGSGPYNSAGLTDGTVYLRVTDEATRIVGYASLLDNTSQDSSISLGLVVQ